MILLPCFLAMGCQRDVQIATAKSDADQIQTEEGTREHLRTAMDFVQDYDRYREDAVLSRILNHLRKWAEPQRPDPNWIADPLFARLPERLELSRNPDLLSRLTFGQAEVELLRESLWTRDLAKRLSSVPPVDAELEAWLTTEFASLFPASDADSLRQVAVIFDWVIRNLRVEPVELTREELEGYTGPAPRPGVRRTAFESLLLGRGDPLARARLVILIARQLEIPCVMVGPTTPDEAAPWWLGVPLGEDVFLFDPWLGIPLPGGARGGIATLREIVAAPAQLASLTADASDPYRVAESDIHDLAIWLDASPEALSQRMRLVERNLTGDQKLVLTTAPSELRLRLARHPGVKQVGIWTQPYDVANLRGRQDRPPRLVEQYGRDMAVVSHPWPLARARRQHIRGVFNDKDFELGARSLYLRMRIPEARRDQLRTAESLNLVLKEILGEEQPLPEDPVELAALVAATQDILRATKANATMWLGLIAFESQDYQVAIDYFDKRILQADPEGPWRDSARYNLARSLEVLARAPDPPEGARVKAIEAYRAAAPSPQRAGDLFRASRLE